MFGDGFVAAFHVEQGEVGVDKLLVGTHLLGLMALGDGGGVIALAVRAIPSARRASK